MIGLSSHQTIGFEADLSPPQRHRSLNNRWAVKLRERTVFGLITRFSLVCSTRFNTSTFNEVPDGSRNNLVKRELNSCDDVKWNMNKRTVDIVNDANPAEQSVSSLHPISFLLANDPHKMFTGSGCSVVTLSHAHTAALLPPVSLTRMAVRFPPKHSGSQIIQLNLLHP